MNVLIDTCAWIDFFKSKTGAMSNRVKKLIEINQAAIIGVIIAELLQGIKQEKEYQMLKILLHSIHYLPTTDSDWFTVGQLARQQRSVGLTLPLTDILIAVIAQRNKVPVLTVDKHFKHLPIDLDNLLP